MLINPVASGIGSFNLTSNGLINQVSSLIPGLPTGHPAITTLSRVSTILGQGNLQMTDWLGHTNGMIFGGGTGIAGNGLQANLGLASSALSLNGTLSSLGALTSQAGSNPGDPCSFLTDFFSSIMAKGQELLGQLTDAISVAVGAVNELIGKIQQTIAMALDAINTAISAAMAAVNEVISQISAKIAEVAQMITDEISKIADWIAKQFNFSLSSFLSGLFNNNCVRLLVEGFGAVAGIGTPILLELLRTTDTRRPVAALDVGRLW